MRNLKCLACSVGPPAFRPVAHLQPWERWYVGSGFSRIPLLRVRSMPLTADLSIVLSCDHCGAAVPTPQTEGAELRCTACGRLFPIDAGVVLLNDVERQTPFTDDRYRKLADVESRHFWFAARTRLILAALTRRLGSLRGRTALDVGCGTGALLAALEFAGATVCGIDQHLAALRRARGRVHGVLVRDDAERLPFASRFDVVTLCDVIEHVEDDVAVVRSAADALRAGGVVLLTVPAGPRLWSSYDAVIGHKRRYTRQQLLQVVASAGLKEAQVRYFNCVTYPALLLQRAAWKRQPTDEARIADTLVRSALAVPPFPINDFLAVVSRLDRHISPFCPFGSSLVATATAGS